MRWTGNGDAGAGTQIFGTGSTRAVANGSQDTTPQRGGAGMSYFVDQSFTVILAADNVPQQCPAFAVPRGCTVRVRANNGLSAGNTGIVFVGQAREVITKPLAPLDDVACPVDNTVRLWFKGKSGDGVVVNVITVAGGNS
jgi:hypothetical protein